MQDGEGTLLRSRSQGGRRASASPRPWGPSGRASADGPANGRTLRMDNETAGAGAPSFLGDIPESANVALWRRLLARQEFWVTFAVIALGVAVTFVTSRFATATNLGNILQNFCYIGLMAIGMTPILITGGIDISIGSILGLCGVVLAFCCRPAGLFRRDSPRPSCSAPPSAPSTACSSPISVSHPSWLRS